MADGNSAARSSASEQGSPGHGHQGTARSSAPVQESPGHGHQGTARSSASEQESPSHGHQGTARSSASEQGSPGHGHQGTAQSSASEQGSPGHGHQGTARSSASEQGSPSHGHQGTARSSASEQGSPSHGHQGTARSLASEQESPGHGHQGTARSLASEQESPSHGHQGSARSSASEQESPSHGHQGTARSSASEQGSPGHGHQGTARSSASEQESPSHGHQGTARSSASEQESPSHGHQGTARSSASEQGSPGHGHQGTARSSASEQESPSHGHQGSARSSASEQGSPGRGHQGKTELYPGLLNELLEELQEVKTEWRNIGLKLGINNSDLEVIRLDCSQRGGVSDSFTTMLDKWLHRTQETRNEIWITICKVLMKLEQNRVASTIAWKHGVSPKIEKQPQNQRAALGGTVTFRCEASTTSGIQISYKWLHNDSEVKEKVASAKLSIKKVTLGDRGKYRCIVSNEFGGEKSDPAELEIGNELNPDSLRRILNEEGIKDTDWPEIVECLEQDPDLRSTFIGGILIRIQECPSDKIDLWLKIAEILEGMEAAARKARKNAGKELNESTVNEIFKEVQSPDWCEIDKKLQQLQPATAQQPWQTFDDEKQKNTELHAHEGSESRMLKPNPEEQYSVATIVKHKNITWEKLAKALDGIQGYESAAKKIKEECTDQVEITRERMDAVFRDANKVNWHQVVETFSSFNESCLIEVLTKWLLEQKGQDPWMYWRKLAASVESLKEGSEDPMEVKCQLGIGYKLRLQFGVGLELNKYNLFRVLKDAGVKDWSVIVFGLKLDPHWLTKAYNKVKNFVMRADVQAQILEKWPNPQSWEELARVINDSKELGPEIAQKTRELSGSGGFPIINHVYSNSKLNVESETTVTFKCEARGAPPLKYTWTCDGKELRSSCSWTVQLKVKRDGEYNCRVDNDFGSYISVYPVQLVCGDAPTCKPFDVQQKNIQTGHELNLHCTAKGSKTLKYTWLHDGKELSAYSGPDLVIEQVKPDAAGKYECRVANVFGKGSSTITIKVGEPPQNNFIAFEGPEKVHYLRGVTLKFYSKASGALTYTWRCRRGSSNPVVGYDKTLEIKTEEETEGKYTCQAKNDFGDIPSNCIEIKVGDKPIVKAPPEIVGEALPGEQVQLTCAVKGKGPFEFVWIHDNQTLVSEAGSCWTEAKLSIEQMTAANQGEYRCHFFNSYGFNLSEPVPLRLGIELEELMKQLCTPISHRWCMFGILLDVKKSILVRISRGFAASGDVCYSLQEVIRSWLEMKHNPQRPHSWETIQDVVQRMGNETLARDLGSLFKTASLTQKKTEKCAKYNAKYMHRGFEELAGKVEKMLTAPDSSNTESGSPQRDADAVVSGIRAYLHLIGFKDEDNIQETTDLHSVIVFLRQYLSYQRYHLLEKVIFQFGSKEAQSEMKGFIDQFSEYQETTSLGNFAPLTQPERSPDDHYSTSEGDPAAKQPPFMNSFKIVLESKWATCTLRDAESLLVNLLPDTVSREFVWYSTAYRAEENSVCLEYLFPPAVIELLRKEMEMRKQTLRSMGIHCVQVDSKFFRTASSITGVHPEEQGANPPAIQLLMKQQAQELRDEARETESKQDSKIKVLRTALEGTSTRQDTEIEALRKALEDTRTKQDSEIEALRKALDDTRTNQDSEIEALRKALEDTNTKQDSEIEALKKALEDTNTKQDSEIEALRKALEDTSTKQGSEIEALWTVLVVTRAALEDTRTDLEDTRTAFEDTKKAHDQEIKALHQKIDALKKNTTTVALHKKDKGLLEADIKRTKDAMHKEMEEKWTDHLAIHHGIRNYSKQAPTKSLHATGIVSPGPTGERIRGSAPENEHRSQEQGQTQEPLDAAYGLLLKKLDELCEAQQRMAELSAKKFEELELKLEKH